MTKTVRFEQRGPRFRPSDAIRVLILCGMGGVVYANQAALEKLGPTRPSSAAQPWIVSPELGAVVPAGIVKFEGTGPTGSKVQVMESKRIVAEGWIKDGTWSVSGKLFGSGQTVVRAVIAGPDGKKSPGRHLTVDGHAEQTLKFTTPLDGEFINAGKVKLSGRGKAGDEIVLYYNDVVIGKVVAGKDARWSKTANISDPKSDGRFKAFSKAEGETALAVVHGPN